MFSSESSTSSSSEASSEVASQAKNIIECDRHLGFFANMDNVEGRLNARQRHSLLTMPIFSSQVKAHMAEAGDCETEGMFTKYGLLGLRNHTYRGGNGTRAGLPRDNLIYSNTSAPWSAFICGQQGAGKSYTLSCLLENALLGGDQLGKNDKALGGIIFHYDKNASDDAVQVCEAAYLCSQGVDVQVLTMPSNFLAMKRAYRIPGMDKQPTVKPLLLADGMLKADHMLTLMGATSDELPLYLGAIKQIIKNMKNEEITFTMKEFKDRIKRLNLTPMQAQPLQLRMSMLKSIVYSTADRKNQIRAGGQAVSFAKSGLTIVDLSCSTVTESDVCSLYQICLSMFLASRKSNAETSDDKQSLIIAVDEAHKFLTDTTEAKAFSGELVRLIREQRHLSCRVLIATQEPTISPTLMDLCDVSIIHRFNSPVWFNAINSHLAGIFCGGDLNSTAGMAAYKTIVNLGDGEALLFCPKAYLDVPADGSEDMHTDDGANLAREGNTSAEEEGGASIERTMEQGVNALSLSDKKGAPVKLRVRHMQQLTPLGVGYIKLQIRKRLTKDGGQSQMAD